MKILFLQDNAINESVALTELSAYLKTFGYETDLFISNRFEHIRKKISSYNPRVILFPIGVFAQFWMVSISKLLQTHFPHIFQIAAGAYPTFYPEILEKSNLDSIIIGEAEIPTHEILEKIKIEGDFTKVENTWVKHQGQLFKNRIIAKYVPYEDLPPPDRDLYFQYKFISKFPFKKFLTSRGCYFNCSFCYISGMQNQFKSNPKIRRKTVDNVIKEIEWVKKNHPTKIIHFCDDIFTGESDWISEFSEQYKKIIDTPFTCNTSPSLIETKSISQLKKAGCYAIQISIESGSEKVRNHVLNKKISNEQIKKAANIVKSNGIKLLTFNMVGSPGEEIKDTIETIKLNIHIKADACRVTKTFAIQNTPLHDLIEKQKTANSSKSNKNWIEKSYCLFRLGVYFPKTIFWIEKQLKNENSKRYTILKLLILLTERRIFKIPLWAGFKYFLHVGFPNKRTSNFSSLV